MSVTGDTPRDHGLVDVGGGHHVYWEEWGDLSGVPVVYLHGGPAGGLGSGAYRRHVDLSRARMIGLDQRGCGRSAPHASDPRTPMSEHTTQHLVADLEVLRAHLGVDRWIVNGASWGSTLTLAYALAHPDRVLGIVCVAVTTTRRWEVDWITEGVGALYPEEWDRFAGHAERAGLGYVRGRGRLVSAYSALMESDDAAVRDAASWAWVRWEDAHVAIGRSPQQRPSGWDDDRFRHAFVRLTSHIWSHDGFCEPPLIERARELAGIPGVLIHGRRDVSGPVVTPWLLHRAWPGSELLVIETDGHGGVNMGEAWDAANERFLRRLSA